MTPAEHIQAIEDAAGRYAKACHENPELDARMLEICGASWALLQAAIRAAVGAASPKDSTEFALAALVAAGHVSQEKVDEARALMPEGGYVPKTAPDVVAELEEVKTVCAEAYQVVGVLLADAGRFDSPEATKILDNLSEQRLRHTDVLPWESKPAPEGWQTIETAPKDGSHVWLYVPRIQLCGYWAGEEWRYVAPGIPSAPPPTHWMPLPAAPKP